MLETKEMVETTRTQKPFKLLGVLAILIVAIAAVVIWGIRSRVSAASAVKEKSLQESIPTVSVVHPKPGALKNEIVLPGNIQAFTDSPIYARASGYLKAWHAELGAHVKAGQVLAEIEAPELDQQVTQARASLQQTQAALDQSTANLTQGKANAELAKVTATRWSNLAAKGVVSRQENDQYQAQYQAQAANVDALEKAIAAARSNIAASEANLARLEELRSYKVVKAPFDGVITARNTDVGALINSGNGGPAQELFHLAATRKLRVFVSVPQVYSRAAVAGIGADLTLQEFPGRKFHGLIVRTAEAIDPGTRTLLTEVNVDNASAELRPGAYAEVHLSFPAGASSLVLPVNALLFRSEGLQVGVVRDGGKVELVRVILGKDFGTEVEVVSGVAASDVVIVNPPDSLTAGAVVRLAESNHP
jgi:RND family efflux transporter MFP subunit